MNKWIHSATLAVLMSAVATPALADNDQLYYEQHRNQFISYEQAGDAALKAVGKGTIVDIEFEHKRSLGDFFDVEVRTPDARKYDVRIDAKTGRVVYSHIDD